MDSSLSAELLQTTTRIRGIGSDGTQNVGSGFFFIFQRDAGNIPLLITNKHVVKDTTKGTITLTLDDNGNKRIEEITLAGFLWDWIEHPNDSVDLCCMPIAGIMYELKSQGKTCMMKSFEPCHIPSRDVLARMTVSETLLVIGYPIGLWDEVNNLPIVRRGLAATRPEIDYNGLPIFLVDAAIHPGSSGSPILALSEGLIVDGANVTLGGNRLMFLGIMSGVYQTDVTGRLVSTKIPTTEQVQVQSFIPINLGIAIQSRNIVDFEKLLVNSE
jgi:hypothetical protein